MMLRTATVVLSFLAISGCATLSPQAELVHVVYNPLEINAQCVSLGVVDAHDPMFYRGPIAQENVERSMRESTAQLGGNVLLPVYAREGLFFGPGMKSRGQAYRCP